MPTNPTYPGVYIEEIPSGVHTITGVATSIGAFFGRASKGPIDKAVRIFNYSDYTRNFGAPYPKSDLADAIRLFFTNGGTDAYVIRLAKDAEKAAITLKSLGGDNVLKATAKAHGEWGNTVRLEVDYKTSNPDETFNMRMIHEEGGKEKSRETYSNLSMNPTSPRFAPAFVTESSELIELELDSTALGDYKDPTSAYNELDNSVPGFSQARRPLGTIADVRTTLKDLIFPAAPALHRSKFDISVNGSPFVTVDLRPWDPLDSGSPTEAQIEAHFKDRIENALETLSPKPVVSCQLISVGGDIKNLLSIVSESGDYSKVTIRRAGSNDIAGALMLGVDQGGVEIARWNNFRPAPTATYMALGQIPSLAGKLTASEIDNDGSANVYTFIGESTNLLNPLADAPNNAFSEVTVGGDTVDLLTKLETTTAGNDWFESKVASTVHGDNDGVREKLNIMAVEINKSQIGKKPDETTWFAEVWGYHLMIRAKNGTINTTATIVSGSASTDEFDHCFVKTAGPPAAPPFPYDFTNVRQYSLGISGTGSFSANGVKGEDGTAPGLTEFLGNADDQTGFHALDPVDIFNLMVIPGDEEITDQTTINSIWGAASTYCKNRRAFLLVDPPANWVNNGRPQVVQDTSMAGALRALVESENSAVFYPNLKYKSNGSPKYIGPSGAIAGLMARIDTTRGVWKAPAGTEATLQGILGLELKLTDMENGVLNKLAVNCLREFPGSFVCWGSRTLDGYDDNSTDWKYIPVRRFTLFLEESLFRGTKWVVFEPNDEPLWAKIRLNVGAFMMRLFKQGAFQGTTPDKAFYVRCDSETTTQADINLGIVNIEVGFAPLKPAEFVIIKIQQMAGEL